MNSDEISDISSTEYDLVTWFVEEAFVKEPIKNRIVAEKALV